MTCKRVATNLDCQLALDTGINVGALTRIPKTAVRIVRRAFEHRYGGGVTLRRDEDGLQFAEDAGLVATFPSRSRHCATPVMIGRNRV